MFYLYADIAQKAILAINSNHNSVELSCDLNLSRRTFSICNKELLLDADTAVNLKQLEKISKKKKRIFIVNNDEIRPLEIRNDNFYKLVPTNTAPYLEISGVKMHISKDICPFESTGNMADAVVKSGFSVLDTCSGLGYSAVRCAKIGAKKIVTVEKNADIIKLRDQNPWSFALNTYPSIEQRYGDIEDVITTFGTSSFDAVIHDPPRFSLAGELYSVAFYKELKRVLKNKGALFHYTGNPHTVKHGNSFVSGAIKRLTEAGFKRVIQEKKIMGVTAFS